VEQLRVKDMVTFLRKCVFCDDDASKMNAAKSCCVCGDVVVVVVKQLYLFFVPPLFSKVTIFTFLQKKEPK
tara:strand:- start:1452 stop:1664 length:213 start_codon:yes stop_codon:yes gene_type:complete